MEIKSELKVYLIEYKCPKCEEGFLKFDVMYHDIRNQIDEKGWIHRCKKCTHIKGLDKKYPYKEYIKDNGLNSIEDLYNSECKCGCNDIGK